MSKQATITEKRCTRCEITKPVEDFYRIGRSHCKECERTEAAERMRDYNATPQGKASQALQTTRKAVRKVEAETGRKVKDDLTIYDVAITLGDSECIYCENEIPEEDRTIEHLTPLRDGGENSFSNIRMACRSCNSVKGDIPLILHFIRQQSDAKQAALIVGEVAVRERISFDEAFAMLTEQVRNYFDNKAAEAIKRIEETEAEDEESEGKKS